MIGIRPSRLFWSLVERPPVIVPETLQRANQYVTIETLVAEKREEAPTGSSARKAYARAENQKRPRPRGDPGFTFESESEYPDHDDALVVMARIANACVRRIMRDTGSSADILYLDAFHKLGMTNRTLTPMTSILTEFTSDALTPVGVATLPVTFGDEPRTKTLMVHFTVVDLPSAYNVIIRRLTLNMLGAVVSTYHHSMKFSTNAGPRKIKSDPQELRRCYLAATTIPRKDNKTLVPDPHEPHKPDTRPEPSEPTLEMLLEKAHPERTV
ncbi:hypothetical protein B296_00058414 [Ensete ventricosum]|uniref:Uncharacterized protein n=1 Tax=Ensete ventricosum TaxID=4639 RepID=A0A426XMF3_ENSVE|nr:hypothetical protein B296_00058414 [Ensete ventricosum]